MTATCNRSRSIVANVLWLGEGCLTDAQFSHKFQWQLLPNRCYLLGGLSAGTKIENEMIYCLKPEMYPTPEQTIEEISYRDENDFEWKIARVENGFFVKYFGEPYFKENYFSCDLKSGEHILINSTNCIFIQDTDFETFAEVRNVIKIGYTDDIWETFQEMFEERFEHDKGLLESELVK